jgi:iron complex outermembrane receptor protein
MRARQQQRTRIEFSARAVFVVVALAVPRLAFAAADDSRKRAELPAVEVLGTVPLPGIAVPIEQVPANIQTGTAEDIASRQALDLPELLERAFDSVNLNATQGNPFQMDVNFRGYSASPLLGTPQGLSVFVDGVRVNESFGDTVNWDLISRIAIDRVALLPGSNPVFGLNTLGGALVIHTKSGFEHPGYGLRVSGGSFGRLGLEAEYGSAANTSLIS